MTVDLAAGLAGLFLLLVTDSLLAAARAALMNSHAPTLRALQEQGVRGSARAIALASEATSLLLSFGVVRYVLRLAIFGLGVGIWFAAAGGRDSVGSLAIIVVGLGLGVALAELVGEALALRAPDRTACTLSPLAVVVVAVASPVRAVHRRLTGPSSGVVPPLVTEEEIKTMVDAGEEGGAIEIEEKEMIFSIFQLGDTLVREVMVPRIDIRAFEEQQTLQEVTEGLLESGHSRAPVFRSDIDKILGIVHVKDLLRALHQGRQQERVGSILRPALFVPEVKKADDLLADLQARRIHMAVVVDEYGGTAGVVTLEDVVEEIVGEIRDEYDSAEESAFERLHEGEFIFSGRMDLDEVNELTGARLSKDTSETLGGFISGRLGRIPKSGDMVEAGGLHMVVEQSSGRGLMKVRATRLADGREAEDDGHHIGTAG
ncbi:MAG TPA: hemolysin family protein [Anaerolineales bacterium]|nr:hemolysin family protein [Anaerolineales bacterium]